MTEEKKSVSEQLMDELEPILNMVDEGGPVHPTEYDESDDIEAAKKITDAVKAVDKIMIGIEGDDLEDASVIVDEYRHLEKDMDYSGAFESDVIESGSIKEKVLKGPDNEWRQDTIWENKEEE
jgi:hypothetical protein